MIFTKIAADLDSNPKIRKAGRDGREVFLFVLRRNALADHGGTLPAHHLEPWYLADQLMMTEAEARNGLSRAVTAGLLREVDGGYSICGWDDEWAKRPLTNGERQERFRQKHSGNRPIAVPVTTSNEPIVTDNGSNGSEKSREDQIRVEEKRVEPPSAGKRKKPTSALPADWSPGPEHVELARKRGVDLEIQVARFKAHAEANDRRCVRWGAAFSQWLLQSWPERKPAAPTQTVLERQLERIAIAEREEAGASS